MFNYTIQDIDGVMIIILKGNILDQSKTLGLIVEVDKLYEQGKKNLIVDFSQTDYINSSGLNVLITLLTKSRDNSGEFYICNVPIRVKQLIEISKLDSIFKIEESLETALQKFK